MVLMALAAAAAISAPGDAPKVVSASLFKNGYAVVFREIPVRGGGAMISEIPQSSLGTFWLWTSNGLKIDALINTTVETSGSEDIGSMDELLLANVGKELEFSIRTDSGKIEKTRAKLLSASGSIVVLQGTSMGVLPKAAIFSIESNDGSIIYKRKTTSTSRVLKFNTSGTGTIYTVGLERGMTWAPAYSLDITDPKKLTMVAKSTVLNDLAAVDNVELRFVTGFPNVPWAEFQEPLLSGQTVDQFTNFLASMGERDAGFAGRRESVMTQNAAPAMDLGAAFTPSQIPGVQAEDLFFYRQPGVTLKRGDRAMYVLFSAKADYSHLYTVSLPDAVQDNERYIPQTDAPKDVWHGIKFKNTSEQPLTTAPATVVKDNQVMGQDTLMYTSVGGEVLVRMNKALDVRAEQTEEELSRERLSLKLPNGVAYDLVTMKGTVMVRNFKSEAVTMKITKDLTGEVVSSTGDPATTKTTKGLRQINPAQRLVWSPTVAAGKSLELSYTYKLYVRSEGY